MAFTQTDLDLINEAIASGALRVRFADRDVMYRSVDELLKAKAEILAELRPPKRRQLRIRTDQGW